MTHLDKHTNNDKEPQPTHSNLPNEYFNSYKKTIIQDREDKTEAKTPFNRFKIEIS